MNPTAQEAIFFNMAFKLKSKAAVVAATLGSAGTQKLIILSNAVTDDAFGEEISGIRV